MSPRKLLVFGGGGHAKVVIATARAVGFEVVAVHDDDATLIGTQVLGAPVIGPIAAAGVSRAVIAIGNNRARQALATRMDCEWVTLVHPSATVHDSVSVGAGTVVFAHAVVQPDARLGCHVIVNTGATVDHDGYIAPFAHLGPGSHLSGGVKVGEGTLIGVGAAAIPFASIGDWATVGAGAVVTRTIPPNATVVGLPARPLVR